LIAAGCAGIESRSTLRWLLTSGHGFLGLRLHVRHVRRRGSGSLFDRGIENPPRK
jgi:hypothetical protein